MTTEPTSKCIDASAHTVEDVVLPTAAYLGLLLSRRLGLLLVQLGERLGSTLLATELDFSSSSKKRSLLSVAASTQARSNDNR